MEIRKRIFHRLIQGLKNHNEAIIIAGLGRCGTTLVYNSFINNHHFSENRELIQLQDFRDQFVNGIAYKTHDYPPVILPKNVKLIFMFGNPMDTVLSYHQRMNDWGKQHHYHLGSNRFKSNDNIFFEDTLNLGELYQAWNKPQNFEFITVRYENLYDAVTIKTLSDFLGFEFRLLPKKQRNTNWQTHPLKDVLFKTYGRLFEQIKKAENVKIWK